MLRRRADRFSTVVLTPECKHAHVLVRDLPDDVHAALQHRAEQRGQSLERYLAGELLRLAQRPTADELFSRIARRRGGKVDLDASVLANALADDGRDGREARRSVAAGGDLSAPT